MIKVDQSHQGMVVRSFVNNNWYEIVYDNGKTACILYITRGGCVVFTDSHSGPFLITPEDSQGYLDDILKEHYIIYMLKDVEVTLIPLR